VRILSIRLRQAQCDRSGWLGEGDVGYSEVVDESTLSRRLRAALGAGDHGLDQLSTREAVSTLLDVYSLHLAPIDTLGGAEQWQHEPRVAQVKLTLERRFRARLGGDEASAVADNLADVTDAFRTVAHDDMVPPIYDWLAGAADHTDLVEFLALEGGPDADFDDLVALCQVGLAGLPKLTLAANYWDEMGRGSLERVHTELHHDMAAALGLRTIPTDRLPLEVLDRRALNGYLATNRSLQPEMLGSLGLLEVQAGPRCRRVVSAMRRLEVPTAALPFYEEHATADPRHGKDWIDGALAPVVVDHPEWAPRILRGARWRAIVNGRFFDAMSARFGLTECAA
jgi:Iron-containing redox enzyme